MNDGWKGDTRMKRMLCVALALLLLLTACAPAAAPAQPQTCRVEDWEGSLTPLADEADSQKRLGEKLLEKIGRADPDTGFAYSPYFLGRYMEDFGDFFLCELAWLPTAEDGVVLNRSRLCFLAVRSDFSAAYVADEDETGAMVWKTDNSFFDK